MDSFKPRQAPPEPQIQNLKPPTYTVPDVTLMFDSDDSLIWKPGNKKVTANNYKILQNLHSSAEPPRGEMTEDDRNNKENCPFSEIQNNEELTKVSPFHKNLHVEQGSVHNLLSYSPQPYVLLNHGQIPLQREFDSREKNNFEDEVKKCQNSHVLPSSMKFISKELERNRERKDNSPSSCSNSKSKSLQQSKEDRFESSCKSNEPVSLAPNFSPQVVADILVNRDAYILKLIEGQNQQIHYLHRVLDKLLENSNNEQRTSKEHHCKKCIQESKITNNAMTQTSHTDFNSNTVDVGTNTDVSWENLISAQGNKINENHDNEVKKSKVIPKFNVNAKNKKEDSYTLKDVVLETVIDPQSPEPSLHINVPEYHDDHEMAHNENYQFEDDDKEYDSPLVGESALGFNERLKGKVPALDEGSQEEKNGVTFYNKVMINVQQVLHKYGNNNQDHQIQFQEQKSENVSNVPMKPTSVLRGICNPTKLQLQQFGISFLDPVTLTDKRKDLAIEDKVRAPDFLIQGNADDLEIFDGRKGKRFVPQNVSDAHLVEIAQKYQAASLEPQNHHLDRGGQHHLGPQKHPTVASGQQQLPRDENEFSFATRKFLGKYKLDN